MQRVECGLSMSAEICRRTRAVEDEGERYVLGALGRIKAVRGRVEAFVRDAPSFQLGEERLEPIWMLVIDRERLVAVCSAHLVLEIVIARHETNPVPSPEVTRFGGPLQFPHTVRRRRPSSAS